MAPSQAGRCVRGRREEARGRAAVPRVIGGSWKSPPPLDISIGRPCLGSPSGARARCKGRIAFARLFLWFSASVLPLSTRGPWAVGFVVFGAGRQTKGRMAVAQLGVCCLASILPPSIVLPRPVRVEFLSVREKCKGRIAFARLFLWFSASVLPLSTALGMAKGALLSLCSLGCTGIRTRSTHLAAPGDPVPDFP